MKNLYLPLVLITMLVLANVARADSFDSDTATIKKCGSSSKCANVSLDKKDYTVPVTFGDGADWSCVKDHYDLSDASCACVKAGHASVTVNSDGSLNWAAKK
jgi:hypothetical protein